MKLQKNKEIAELKLKKQLYPKLASGYQSCIDEREEFIEMVKKKLEPTAE